MHSEERTMIVCLAFAVRLEELVWDDAAGVLYVSIVVFSAVRLRLTGAVHKEICAAVEVVTFAYRTQYST